MTLLLIWAHALGFAQATVCAPDGHDAPACEHVAPATDAAAVDAGDGCHECGMSHCRDMASCTASTTALSADRGPAWTPAAAHATDPAPVRALHSHTRAPTRPPPRA